MRDSGGGGMAQTGCCALDKKKGVAGRYVGKDDCDRDGAYGRWESGEGCSVADI